MTMVIWTKVTDCDAGVKGRIGFRDLHEYQINQSQYYLWRDQFLKRRCLWNAAKAQQQTLKNARETNAWSCDTYELTDGVKKKRYCSPPKDSQSFGRRVAAQNKYGFSNRTSIFSGQLILAYLRFASPDQSTKNVYRLWKKELSVSPPAIGKRTSSTRQPRASQQAGGGHWYDWQ